MCEPGLNERMAAMSSLPVLKNYETGSLVNKDIEGSTIDF